MSDFRRGRRDGGTSNARWGFIAWLSFTDRITGRLDCHCMQSSFSESKKLNKKFQYQN